MSPRTPDSCQHERRPGTTVCIQCRRDSAATARDRRRRLLIGSAFATLTFGVLAAARAAGTGARHGHRPKAHSEQSGAVARPADGGQELVAEAPRAVANATTGAPPLAPVVAEGQTALRDGVSAERAANSVTVRFDMPMVRTRRRDKFERIVRVTLPQVYGPAADTVLAGIPEGNLAQSGDLLTELPTRGIRLPLASGHTLVLWPETRPGQDGPLVIAYRSTVTSTGNR